MAKRITKYTPVDPGGLAAWINCPPHGGMVVNCVSAALLHFAPLLRGPNGGALDHERLAVLAVDRRLRLLDVQVLCVGSEVAVVHDTKQILRWALTRSMAAHGVIVAHNHPSGDPTPSPEDIVAAKRLLDGCKAVGLELLDSLTVGDCGSYASLKERQVV